MFSATSLNGSPSHDFKQKHLRIVLDPIDYEKHSIIDLHHLLIFQKQLPREFLQFLHTLLVQDLLLKTDIYHSSNFQLQEVEQFIQKMDDVTHSSKAEHILKAHQILTPPLKKFLLLPLLKPKPQNIKVDFMNK
jgi:hypothetical protein